MPELVIHTNVSKDKVTPAVLTSLTNTMAATLGKPKQYCTVRIVPDQLMLFGGTADPCAQASLMSIGLHSGTDGNIPHSAAIFKAVHKLLGVPDDRMYLTFIDKESSDVGFKSTTFREILGQ